jgi:hypothetical protein
MTSPIEKSHPPEPDEDYFTKPPWEPLLTVSKKVLLELHACIPTFLIGNSAAKLDRMTQDKVLLRCLILGPPLGLLTLTFETWFFNEKYPAVPDGIAGTMMFFAIIGWPFAYLFGVIPAAIGGVLLTEYGKRFGRPPFWVPIAITLLLIPFGMMICYRQISPNFENAFSIVGLLLGVPAFLCWFFCRKFWRDLPN